GYLARARLNNQGKRSLADQFQELLLGQYPHAERLRFVELAAGIFAGDDEVGLLRDAAGRFAAELVDQFFDLVAREFFERSRDDDALFGQFARALLFDRRSEIEAQLAQLRDDLASRL